MIVTSRGVNAGALAHPNYTGIWSIDELYCKTGTNYTSLRVLTQYLFSPSLLFYSATLMVPSSVSFVHPYLL